MVFLEDERWSSYDDCAPFFWKGAFSFLAGGQLNLAKVPGGSMGMPVGSEAPASFTVGV
jgi:hypothetical protein